jgi:myosin heavy subunit
MDTLQNSNPYFIRCIRTNGKQMPMSFDDALVMEQLKSTGMSETVKIKQSSYPIRIPHDSFKTQYTTLIPKSTNTRAKIRRLLLTLGLTEGTFQVGQSLIFLKESSKRTLDEKLEFAVIDKG